MSRKRLPADVERRERAALERAMDIRDRLAARLGALGINHEIIVESGGKTRLALAMQIDDVEALLAVLDDVRGRS